MQIIALKNIFRGIVLVPPIMFGLFAVIYYKYKLSSLLVLTMANIAVGFITMRGMLLSAALEFSPLVTIIVVLIAVAIILEFGSINQEIYRLIQFR
ncbi:MAG: hypothetical protein ACFFCZ_29370 [Promethearchaeota archaeon]